MGRQLGVTDFADERGSVLAVDEPVRILPGVEAGGAKRDFVQGLILSVMFLCTAVYRAENGQGTWRYAAGTAVTVVACTVGSAYRYGDGDHFTRQSWIAAFLLAVLTFGTAPASRRRHTPRMLTGLGTISYSVYLVHTLLRSGVLHRAAAPVRADPPLHRSAESGLVPQTGTPHAATETSAPAEPPGEVRLLTRVCPTPHRRRHRHRSTIGGASLRSVGSPR